MPWNRVFPELRSARGRRLRSRRETESRQKSLEQTQSTLKQTQSTLDQTRSSLDQTQSSLKHVNGVLRATEDELKRITTAAEEQRIALVQTALDSLFQLRRHLADLHAFELNHDQDEGESRRQAGASGLLGAAAKVERSGELMVKRMAKSVTLSDTEPRELGSAAPPIHEPSAAQYHTRRPPAALLTVARPPSSPRPPRPMSAAGALLAPSAVNRMSARGNRARTLRRSRSFEMPTSRPSHMDRTAAPPVGVAGAGTPVNLLQRVQ